MEHDFNCPICKQKATREYYTGPVGVEEEYVKCKNCGYYYFFQYGFSIEEVGKYVIGWSWTTPWYPLHKKLGKVEKIARRNYKKYKKKTNDYTDSKICIYYGKKKEFNSSLFSVL